MTVLTPEQFIALERWISREAIVQVGSRVFKNPASVERAEQKRGIARQAARDLLVAPEGHATKPPIEYVCGFLFSPCHRDVVLIRKARGPMNMAGRLNGVGGKVEEAETPALAMIREFREETGLNILCWELAVVQRLDNAIIYFCVASDSRAYQATTTTDEQVSVLRTSAALRDPDLMPDLHEILPLCRDFWGGPATLLRATSKPETI